MIFSKFNQNYKRRLSTFALGYMEQMDFHVGKINALQWFKGEKNQNVAILGIMHVLNGTPCS